MFQTKFFDTDVDKVYIMLGDACNMKCKYCFHNSENMPYIDEKINEDIFPFIETMASRQKTPLNIRFFGGEPLLYFDKIKYITEKLCHVPNIYFTSITNAKALTQEIVDFFNQYDFMITVSWDGHKASKKYRGFDAFEEKRELLMQIKKLELSVTFVDFFKVDDFLKDLEEINNEYIQIHETIIGFAWSPIDDTGSQKEYLIGSHKDLLKEAYKFVAKIKKAIIKKNKTPLDLALIYALYSDVCTIEYRDFGTNKERTVICGSDNPKTYSIDLNGDFYQFHRYPKSSKNAVKLGNIYMHYFAYIANYYEHTKKYTEQCERANCKYCKINYLCRGPGPNVCLGSEKRCCELKNAMLTPVHELIEWLKNGGIDEVTDE